MASNVSQLRNQYTQRGGDAGGGAGHNGGGDPPGGSILEKRVEALEKSLAETREKVVRIEAIAESIQTHGSTKADVEAMGRSIIQWMILTGIGLAGLAFAAARYIHP